MQRVALDVDGSLAEANDVDCLCEVGRAGVVGGNGAIAGGLGQIPVAECDVVGIHRSNLVVVDEPASVVVVRAADVVAVRDGDLMLRLARPGVGEWRHVHEVHVRRAPDVEIEIREAHRVGDIDADHVHVRHVRQRGEAVHGLRGRRIMVAGKHDSPRARIRQHCSRLLDDWQRRAVRVEHVAGEDQDVGVGFLRRLRARRAGSSVRRRDASARRCGDPTCARRRSRASATRGLGG